MSECRNVYESVYIQAECKIPMSFTVV